MSAATRAVRSIAVLALALAWWSAPAARADKYFGVAGGAFVPYEGDTGWTALMESGSDWTSKYVRVGGELVFSDLERTIDYTAVGGPRFQGTMRTYEARFVTRYVMFPGRVTPYVGVSAGLIVVQIDDGSVAGTAVIPGVFGTDDRWGFGGGLGGHIGLEIPLFSKALNLFGEARADYQWEFTDNLAPIAGSSDFSGFSGIAGIRARF
jgi:hypothetical protein